VISENVSIDDEAMTVHAHSFLADTVSVSEWENVPKPLAGKSVLPIGTYDDFRPFRGRIVDWGAQDFRRQKFVGDGPADFKIDCGKNHISWRSTVVDQLGKELRTLGFLIPSRVGRQVSSEVATDAVEENIRSLQIGQGALGNSGRFSSGQPQADSGNEKQSVEQGQQASEDRDGVARPVIPIRILGWIFATGCGGGGLLMWILARRQDRMLP
jgi:hypothetical protein